MVSVAPLARAQVPVKHPLFQHPALGGIADRITGHLGGALFEQDNADVIAAEERQMADDGHHK